jgi:hypothetical protein
MFPIKYRFKVGAAIGAIGSNLGKLIAALKPGDLL